MVPVGIESVVDSIILFETIESKEGLHLTIKKSKTTQKITPKDAAKTFFKLSLNLNIFFFDSLAVFSVSGSENMSF